MVQTSYDYFGFDFSSLLFPLKKEVLLLLPSAGHEPTCQRHKQLRYNHTQQWQCSVSDRGSYVRDYSDISCLKILSRSTHVYWCALRSWAQQIFMKTFSSRKTAANFLLQLNLTLFHGTLSKCQHPASKQASHLLKVFCKTQRLSWNISNLSLNIVFLICGNKRPTGCNRMVFIAKFTVRSTCSGHHCAHHQQLKNCTEGCWLWYMALWFTGCWSGMEL
jgi:hypothetical protein